MKLISEEIESVDILTEEKDGKKTLYIQGPFLQAEVVNRNKRCYPIGTMVNEVKRYNEEFVSKGRGGQNNSRVFEGPHQIGTKNRQFSKGV